MDRYKLKSDLLEDRKNIVHDVANKIEGIGKTGMMKAMYFLQQVYKVPLGYDFRIHSFGPFDEDVLAAIDFAEKKGLIDVVPEDYSDGVSGYSINATKNEQVLLSEYSEPISDLLANFGEYTAKEWELTSTIVYLYVAYMDNGWDLDELDENVKRIKPRFELEEIQKERELLNKLGILDRAV